MSSIPSCDKCSKTFSTKQMRDYHIKHNSCKISAENSNFNSNMHILESMEKEIKELKRMMMCLLKNVEELKTEIKELKSVPQQEKKQEVKEEIMKSVPQQEKKEEKKEEEDKTMFDQYPNGVIHIGTLTYTEMKQIKNKYITKGKVELPLEKYKKTPENDNRVRLYLGIPIKPIEKKEEPKPEPQPKEEEEDEEEEDETDEDKAFGEYCDKDEYGVYHIGGIQSDSLTRLKDFYINRIPKDLLYGERKTKCVDKMDYLKREFASKFSNDFSGSKDDYNKLKFYFEN